MGENETNDTFDRAGVLNFYKNVTRMTNKEGPVAHGLHNSSNALSRNNNKFC